MYILTSLMLFLCSDHNNASRLDSEDEVEEVDTAKNITVLQRLIRDLFKGYDKDTPPILNHRDYIDIQIDLTYRQVTATSMPKFYNLKP